MKSINGRYYVEIPSTSVHHSMTPPRSPHKPLPHAPNPASHPIEASKSPISREKTSAKSFKHKESVSPFREQATPATRVEPVVRVTSSERARSTKSPVPAAALRDGRSASPLKGVDSISSAKHAKSKTSYKGKKSKSSDKDLEPSTSAKGPVTAPAARMVEPVSLATGVHSTSPMASSEPPSSKGAQPASSTIRVEPNMSAKIAEETSAVDESELISLEKALELAPEIPARSLSRRTSMSITERRRSITRKLSFLKDNRDGEANTANANFHIQIQPIPDIPTHTASASMLQRHSSRRRAAMSVSVYSSSGSPTTPTGRTESPVPREASPPVVSASGEPVPAQSTYGTMSFLPMISPIRDISFFDTELPSRGHSRAHSRSQSGVPIVLHSQPEEDDSHIHPLFRESRQESDRSTETSGIQHKSSHNILHPSSNHSNKDSDDHTRPIQQQSDLSAREIKEHENSASHPDARIEGNDVKEDVLDSNTITELAPRSAIDNSNKLPQLISLPTSETNSKKQLQEMPRAPLSDSEKIDRDLIRSHHLLYAAMSKTENNLADPNPVAPSAQTETKSTSSTFHPLLEEVRHKKFASKMGPLVPPRKITGDLPLRNYRSQESLLSQDLRPSRDDNIRTSRKRSSSVYQRGSRQFTSPLASTPERASISYSPEEPSVAAPSSDLVTLPKQAIQNNTLAQPAEPDVTATPPAEFPDTAKDLKQVTVSSPRSLESLATEKVGVHHMASKKNTTESEQKTSGSSENEAVNTAAAPSNPSNEKYKTSATNNAPFYLNPVSSAALLEFLAETPPASPPNPNKTQNLPLEATVTSQPVQRDSSSKTMRNHNSASAPPPPSFWQVPSGPPGPPPSGPPPSVPQTLSKPRPPIWPPPASGILSMAPGALPPAITRPLVPLPPPGPPPASGSPGAPPPEIARPPPPGTVSSPPPPPQSAAPKKSGGLKKFFGVGSSSNTSSTRKKEKRPKGPLVIGEPQLIVVPNATKKEKGKAKASKTSKKGVESERSKHDDSNGNDGSGNGNDKDKDNNPDDRFMGVGKDGVWISRQNFVKT